MKKGGPRKLPVVATAYPTAVDGAREPATASAAMGGAQHLGLDPDPARIQAGWQHRFVAEGARAEEMIRLYGELGFEVAGDPVLTDDGTGVCSVCFGSTGQSYRAIYTRRLPRHDVDAGGRPEEITQSPEE